MKDNFLMGRGRGKGAGILQGEKGKRRILGGKGPPPGKTSKGIGAFTRRVGTGEGGRSI